MKPTHSGTAKLRITATNEIVEIQASEVSWEQDGGDERSMGTELRYVAESSIESKSTGHSYDVRWQLWEYPAGVQNHNDTEVDKGLEIVEDFSYGLVHEPEEE